MGRYTKALAVENGPSFSKSCTDELNPKLSWFSVEVERRADKAARCEERGAVLVGMRCNGIAYRIS